MCLQKAFNVAFSLQALDGQRVGPDVTDSRPLVCQGVQADVTPSVGAGVSAGCAAGGPLGSSREN